MSHSTRVWRPNRATGRGHRSSAPFVALTAGRQDIVLGDFWNWWLVADGTPLDGSWSYYLDSVRVTWAPPEIKTKFDYILIHQQADASERIPTINNKSPYVTEQDEMGLILYASNQSVKNTRIDGYFIYKRDERVRPNGDDANIYTVGTKVTGNPWTHWSYSVEGGYQFGDKTDPTLTGDASGLSRKRDLRAFGVNTRLSYLLGDRLNNQFSVIYEYLSGDDPNTTGRDEMFDVLWGRWPRWSELYIYSYLPENSGKIAQLNNIQRVGAGWNLVAMEDSAIAIQQEDFCFAWHVAKPLDHIARPVHQHRVGLAPLKCFSHIPRSGAGTFDTSAMPQMSIRPPKRWDYRRNPPGDLFRTSFVGDGEQGQFGRRKSDCLRRVELITKFNSWRGAGCLIRAIIGMTVVNNKEHAAKEKM
jgi:hypothetical protein